MHILILVWGAQKGESASYIVPLTELRPAIRLAFAAARDVAPPKGKTKKTREEHNEKVHSGLGGVGNSNSNPNLGDCNGKP